MAANTSATLPDPLLLTATVTDPTGGLGGTISVSWTTVSGPGSVTFDAQQAVTHATFSAAGSYVLKAAASDFKGSNFVQVGPIVVSVPTVPSQGWIASPLGHSSLSGVVPITVPSTVTLKSGTLFYYPVSNPAALTVLSSNTQGSGTIGYFDTTKLRNGTYFLLLAATDSTLTTKESGVYVTVTGNYKPGRVTATVTDLVVPAHGLAIRIERRYDSLEAGTSSDFGYGWSLGTRIDLETNAYGDVTFTLGGRRRTFYFTPTAVVPIGGINAYRPRYTPEPGARGTLVATPMDLSTNCEDVLYQYSNGNFYCAFDFSNSPNQPYQAHSFTYLYTDPSGTQYSIGSDGSLYSIVDLNGNTLTVTPNGISSNSGTGLNVPFQRDGLGRITQITAPADSTQSQIRTYTYGYDAVTGDLASVTYPGIATPAQYKYVNHFMTEEWDRNGNKAGVSTYDPVSGRLSSVTDEVGNTTQISYDLSTNTTTITNPDPVQNPGKIVTVSDAAGNPLSATDPLGHTTTYTYDANENLLTRTDPLGKTWSYTYDANGFQTSETDPLGNSSSKVYNQYGGPTTITDPVGNVQHVTYDASFNPATITDSLLATLGPVGVTNFDSSGTMTWMKDANGKKSSMQYDSQGNVSQVTDPLNRQASAIYDVLGERISLTDAMTNTTTYTYDPAGRLTKTTFPDTSISSAQYDGNGNVTVRTDTLQRQTVYKYDNADRLILTTYPDKTTTSTTYNWRGQPLTQTDQAGHVTFNVYDLAGQLTQTTTAYNTPDAATTQYGYDAAGRRTSMIDPRGNTTKSVYDDAGRLVQTVDALGESTTYTLDAAGRQTAVTDALGRVTQYAYDARGRVTQVTYPDGTTTKSTYDGTGHVTYATDQADKVTHSVFDESGQLQSVTDAMSQTTSYTYDTNGNLWTRTDANTHTSTLTYDIMNRLKTRTIPGGGAVETFDYNPTGTIADVIDFKNKKTTFTYDPQMDRLLTRTPDPSFSEPAVSYTYYPNGQRWTMTDASGTTTYTYDNQNRLKTKATPEGTLSYTYDQAGNRRTVSSSNTNGTSAVYTYDNLNRLQTVTDNNAPAGLKVTSYTYDPVGNLGSTALPNGVVVTPSVDLMNRVQGMAATSQPAAAYNYLYGKVGNRTYAEGSVGGPVLSSSYVYDGVFRLTQESIAGAAPQQVSGVLSYGLDAVGNRKTLASTVAGIGAQAASYDNNDRVVGISYDANGNLLGASGAANVYDSQDRLKSFNNGAVTMVYDGDGNRVSKTAGGVTTVYLVDEGNPKGLPQVVEEVSGTTAQKTYLYGLARISQTKVATATVSYYGYDGHGDVRYLTDLTGAVTDTYDYDAFGNVVGTTGGTANVYRYQGEAFDAETGLYYLRARYYDPVAGRFLSVDPKADQGQHPYAYAGADPVNGHDPTGTQDVIEYSTAVAMILPPPGVLAGMANDIKCIWGLTASALANPGFMIGRVAGCMLAASVGHGRGGGPPPFGGGGPCGKCSCSAYPVYNPSLWNAPGMVNHNNCYTYGWGVPKVFPDASLNPGGRTGHVEYLVGDHRTTFTCDDVKVAAHYDGYEWNDGKSCCPKGYHPVILVVGDVIKKAVFPHPPETIHDYHWYRQDSNGLWSSKHGGLKVGEQVQDPFADGDMWGYKSHCGRMVSVRATPHCTRNGIDGSVEG